MQTIKIFLASSAELAPERLRFEQYIGRKNKDMHARGVFFELLQWEDFLDAMSHTRLQDEYDRAIRGCDLFVMLFWTKVGKYTEEEFDTAFRQFKSTDKPFIFTYYKDLPAAGDGSAAAAASLQAFQARLAALGHFQTRFKEAADLLLHFDAQLDKLAARGFIEFSPGPGAILPGVQMAANAMLAQGTGAQVQRIDTGGGAYIGGNVTVSGNFAGRDQTNYTSAMPDIAALFAGLMQVIEAHAGAERRAAALAQVEQLRTEVAKGKSADDGRLARILDGLAGMVPAAVSALAGMFATPVLSGLAGPVTRFVLDKFRTD
ncbi:MAG: hypothetical protein KF778_03550 [Rhodocyclaceae bacterium]|nr:hypothetical protein [Rhodocyclaceae bacterium]MBX3667454.1 hypothetical protein [Rhodocyclaceae bacterium]